MTCHSHRRGGVLCVPQACEARGEDMIGEMCYRDNGLGVASWATCHSAFCQDVSLINGETVEEI